MAKTTTNELEKTSTELKHNFSEDELKGLANILSETIQKKSALENEFKNVKNEYKMKIENLDSEIITTNEKYTQKYEMRDTPCYLHRNFIRGMREYLSALDKTDILREEPLTKEDHQLKMKLDDEEK